jgi:hypothetical protein
MRIILAAIAMVSLGLGAGCATRQGAVRCDRHLTPINAPVRPQDPQQW